jgi:hypothetical protein
MVQVGGREIVLQIEVVVPEIEEDRRAALEGRPGAEPDVEEIAADRGLAERVRRI